tara:strand:+ start:4146 stop:7802 length:3657 start_codon:yes stop_codon:yes gene_type:complete
MTEIISSETLKSLENKNNIPIIDDNFIPSVSENSTFINLNDNDLEKLANEAELNIKNKEQENINLEEENKILEQQAAELGYRYEDWKTISGTFKNLKNIVVNNFTEPLKVTAGGVGDMTNQLLQFGTENLELGGEDFLKESGLGDVDLSMEAPQLPTIPEPNSQIGKFTRGVVQFASGFYIAPALKFTKAGTGSIAFRGGIADALFDPEEGNLSTMIKEFGFEYEVIDFLDSKVGEDALAEDRLRARAKNVLEGGALGSIVDALIFGFKIAKKNENLVNTIKKGLRGDEYTYDIQTAIRKTKADTEKKAALAKKMSLKNKKLSSNLIKEWEQSIGARGPRNIDRIIDQSKLISKIDKDGFLIIDPEKARAAGGVLLDDQLQKTAKISFLKEADGTLTNPILNAEKLNAFTAAASELLQSYPKLVNKDAKIVDNLFTISVGKHVDGKMVEQPISSEELLTVLNKYNVSFEEYTTMMLSSASEAGKILNKFSQISKRARGKGSINEANNTILTQQRIFQYIRRVENIRRGSLVSQVATAGRNLTSAVVRSPLESMSNVIDTVLYNAEREGSGAAFKAVFDKTTWKDSFAGTRHLFDPVNYGEYKGYVDLILSKPELAEDMTRMFDAVNEVRKSTGKGTDMYGDTIMTFLENGVDVLNTPNRLQEFLVRRTAFMGELERLTKREYGIDLIQTLNDGKLNDLFNDSLVIDGVKIIKEGDQSFKNLVAESVDKALDITYAKQPDTYVFRQLSNIITNSGLTVVAPFPRFMFNSLELFGDYGAGALYPVMKKAISPFIGADGKLTTKDRTAISRNILGWTAILPAAMMYRQSDDAPSDYKMLRTDSGHLLETTAQSPLIRQSLWVAEANERWKAGDLAAWLEKQGFNDFKETFLGVNVRVGTGEVLFKDLVEIFNQADATAGEKTGQVVGEAFGNWFASFLTPLNQVIDAQRGAGFRTSAFMETRDEKKLPTGTGTENFASSFATGFARPFKAKSYTTLFVPSKDEKRNLKQTIFQEGDIRYRVFPLLKVFSGIALKEDVSEAGDFMQKLGYKDWMIKSRQFGTASPGWDAYQQKVLREVLPTIVEHVRTPEFRNLMLKRADERTLEQKAQKSNKTFLMDKQRRYIDEQLAYWKRNMDNLVIGTIDTETQKPKSVLYDIELTAYLKAVQKFRRLSKGERRDAINELPTLLREQGLDGIPNLSKLLHIETMLQFVKESKALTKKK